jgi:hypothetical protein
VDGAALVIAVTLDPTVAGDAAQQPSAEPTVPDATTASAAVSYPPAPVFAGSQPTQAASRGQTTLRWRGFVGMGVGVASGVAPRRAAPGLLLSFGVESVPRSIWAPAGFIDVELDGGSTSVPTSSVRFIRILGRAVACPVRLRRDAAWGIRPCAVMEAGELEANSPAPNLGREVGRRGNRRWGVAASLHVVRGGLTSGALDGSGGGVAERPRRWFAYQHGGTGIVQTMARVAPGRGGNRVGLRHFLGPQWHSTRCKWGWHLSRRRGGTGRRRQGGLGRWLRSGRDRWFLLGLVQRGELLHPELVLRQRERHLSVRQRRLGALLKSERRRHWPSRDGRRSRCV